MAEDQVKVKLPLWVYWEGQRPLWIDRCLETHLRHWGDVRLLDWPLFDALWTEDRDLTEKVRKLYVSHQSDIIRAYLISRYGGLWIDADCIVFRDLTPVFNLLAEHDFVCAPQHDGDISSAFVASKPGGVIASRWYARQTEILRNGEKIEWLSFAHAALMNAIWKTQETYYRVRGEVIQPVWWNDAGAFFKQRADADHVPHLVPSAFCYMMSNNTLKGFGRTEAELTRPDTFFSFLLRCSRQNAGAAPIAVSGKPHVGNY